MYADALCTEISLHHSPSRESPDCHADGANIVTKIHAFYIFIDYII